MSIEVENLRKKRTTISDEQINIIRIQLELEKSLKEILILTSINYNSVWQLANKILTEQPDVRLTFVKGIKVKNKTPIKIKVEFIVNGNNGITQAGILEEL